VRRREEISTESGAGQLWTSDSFAVAQRSCLRGRLGGGLHSPTHSHAHLFRSFPMSLIVAVFSSAARMCSSMGEYALLSTEDSSIGSRVNIPSASAIGHCCGPFRPQRGSNHFEHLGGLAASLEESIRLSLMMGLACWRRERISGDRRGLVPPKARSWWVHPQQIVNHSGRRVGTDHRRRI
jgi:hypothetical protein